MSTDPDRAGPDTPPNTEPADPREAARRALVQGVHMHPAVRRVRANHPPGSDEWRTATPLVRALEGAVRRQIETARTAGIGPAELALVVGIGRDRIDRIVQEERALTAAAEAAHRDGAAQRARDAAVAEPRAADRVTPPLGNSAGPCVPTSVREPRGGGLAGPLSPRTPRARP
jgi:hypothetical protein